MQQNWLEEKIGTGDRRWIQELIDELYKEYARLEAERGFAEIEKGEYEC